MNIITVGIDLAKNVFAVHGVNDSGKAALVKPKVQRADLLPLIAQLPPCLIGMEACSGAHHWARLFRQHGHTVKLMAPKFVAHLEDLPGYANLCVGDLLAHADELDKKIDEYDRAIAKVAREDARSKRLMKLPGIGPVTASAFAASMGSGHDFSSGRQVAAWIGLVPGQYSSGGKARLGRITKAGDGYLRSLLVMGARAVLNSLGDKQDRFSRWARSLQERRGYWRAVIAIAAKNARLAWAVLKYGEDFKLEPGKD